MAGRTISQGPRIFGPRKVILGTGEVIHVLVERTTDVPVVLPRQWVVWKRRGLASANAIEACSRTPYSWCGSLAFIAYACAGRSTLIVLDEPHSGLDPDALDRLAAAVRLCSETGAAVVVSSHQVEELEASCDRILFLREGSLIGEYTRAEAQGRRARDLYREISNGVLASAVSNG